MKASRRELKAQIHELKRQVEALTEMAARQETLVATLDASRNFQAVTVQQLGTRIQELKRVNETLRLAAVLGLTSSDAAMRAICDRALTMVSQRDGGTHPS